jgi:hypothetical protein
MHQNWSSVHGIHEFRLIQGKELSGERLTVNYNKNTYENGKTLSISS